MSDRVYFATNKPTTPSDAWGFSGFPFRMQTPATTGVPVGDGTEFPIGLPLDATPRDTPSCNRWFRRGKTIDLDTDFTYTDGTGAHTTSPQTLIKVSFPTRELEIIQSGLVQRDLLTDTDISIRMFQTNRWISSDAGLFYPNLDVRSALTDTVRLVSIDPGGAAATITATFDTEPFTLYVIDSGAVSFSITKFDLTFSEYWAYKGKNGSPIWNTTTGALLQSPNN